MGRRLTTIDFIEKSNKKHDDKYNYSLVEYINNKSKVKIICPDHGMFLQQPNEHMRGQKCPKCRTNYRKVDSNFIEKCINKYGEKYDYSLVNYTGNKNNVKIICDIHGVFEQIPNNHLRGSGCPKCINYDHLKLNIGDFIERSNEIHNNKYDYSLVVYKNSKTKVKIICPKHGIFEQIPKGHLNGRGCIHCSNDLKNELFKKDISVFIIESNDIHDNKYDYSLVEYKNSKTKVKIICHTHGVFEQTPYIHTCGHGCPKCNESKGEREISKLLEMNNFKYESQKSFNKCRYKSSLFFDFYLPEYNICIEYDGKQHYEPIGFFGGEEGFEKTQIRDNIKNKYCKDNNIILIRIRYDENINDKLEHVLNDIKTKM